MGEDLTINAAVALFSSSTTSIHSLWSFFAAATFAAVGYTVGRERMSFSTAMFITVGYWTFLFGHMMLLYRIVSLQRAVAGDIHNHDLALGTASSFHMTFNNIFDAREDLRGSIAIHLIIDLCATLAIWRHVVMPERVIGLWRRRPAE